SKPSSGTSPRGGSLLSWDGDVSLPIEAQGVKLFLLRVRHGPTPPTILLPPNPLGQQSVLWFCHCCGSVLPEVCQQFIESSLPHQFPSFLNTVKGRRSREGER